MKPRDMTNQQIKDAEDKLRERWPFDGHCPECGDFHHHTPECLLCPDYFRPVPVRRLMDRSKMYRDLYLEYRREVTFWQGKHAMVVHENNKLRRQCEKFRGMCDDFA